MYNIFKLLINNLSKYKNTLKSVFLKHRRFNLNWGKRYPLI